MCSMLDYLLKQFKKLQLVQNVVAQMVKGENIMTHLDYCFSSYTCCLFTSGPNSR